MESTMRRINLNVFLTVGDTDYDCVFFLSVKNLVEHFRRLLSVSKEVYIGVWIYREFTWRTIYPVMWTPTILNFETLQPNAEILSQTLDRIVKHHPSFW